MDTVIEALTAIQERRRLSTKQMAARLGYHVNHWNKLRSGRYPVNDKFRMKALTAFPELAGLFLPLKASDTSVNASVIVPESRPARRQPTLKERVVATIRSRMGRLWARPPFRHREGRR